MPEIAWETLIGALALVAIVAGAQYVRTSSSSATPVKQLATEVGKKAGAGKKKKGKKTAAAAAAAVVTGEKETKKEAPRSEEKSEAAPSSSSSSATGEASYANVAEKAAQQSGVGHDEVIVPATTAAKASSKKKNKKAKAVAESSTSQATAPTEQPAKPDTSNDASLAAALSAEEPQDSSSEQESDAPAVAPVASSKRDAGGWEKPKKSINTSDAAWESASSSVSRTMTSGKAGGGSGSGGSITSSNRFSALSLSLPASSTQHAKKALPRTSTTGTGKHRAHVEEPGMTKLQKKNAATAAAKKAAKEAEERERLERLAKYRREQEREKINALYSGPKQGGSKISVAANNRSLSNGMKASVDGGGKLVWD